jgi:hypothetical protein
MDFRCRPSFAAAVAAVWIKRTRPLIHNFLAFLLEKKLLLVVAAVLIMSWLGGGSGVERRRWSWW